MALYFFETSALAKRYLQETGTAWVRAITDTTAANVIYVAEITGVELISAITKSVRKGVSSGGISKPDGTKAIKDFRDDFTNQYQVFEITSEVIKRAMDLTEAYPLRAYDAVQLSAALELDLQIKALAQTTPFASALPSLITVSADIDLNNAATSEGLMLEDPRNHP